MDPALIVIFAVVAVVILIFSVFGYLDSREREADWQRVAEELGFSFVDHNNDVMDKDYKYAINPEYLGMKTFSDRPRFCNAIEGQVGNAKVTIGDYFFSTGGGNRGMGPSVACWTVCIVRNRSCHFPHSYCYLRQGTIGGKLGALLHGHQDFADDPEFSKYFVVEGHHDLFDENLRVRCLEFRDSGIYIEAKDDILIYHYGKECKPGIASQMMQEALEILDLLSNSSPNRK